MARSVPTTDRNSTHPTIHTRIRTRLLPDPQTCGGPPADTPVLRLGQMQGQRYWVERAFEDAKGECGLADYQVLGWRAWHHHVTMVMLAMLFIAEQRVANQPGLVLLTPRDIVEMLKETLPRKPEGKDVLVARINQRHQRRRGAIESRFALSAGKRPRDQAKKPAT
jgi:hypothetical protein